MFSSPQKGFIQHHFSKKKSGAGFTLIELLVVIGVLAVLATTTVLILNPAEFLAKSRDSVRVSDLKTLDKALQLFEVAILPNDGDPTKVYVSLPTSGAVRQDCSSSGTNEYPGLPPLPSGKNYSCAPSVSFRSVTGNGWIPVDFTSIPQGSPLATLPIDPVNSHINGTYYTYTMGGSWKLTALMEANKHDQSINDGGVFPGVYEIGTNLTLTSPGRDQGLVGYWPMDEATGTTIYDASGKGNDGVLTNGATITTSNSGKFKEALLSDGVDDYVNLGNSGSLNAVLGSSNKTFSISVWAKPTSYINYSTLLNKASSGSYSNSTVGLWSDASGFRCIVGSNVNSNPPNSYRSLVSAPSTGQWHHVVCVGDGSSLTMYVDGVSVGSISISVVDPTSNSTNAIIGRRTPASGESFPGSVDELRIYNRALSVSEILSLYNLGN